MDARIMGITDNLNAATWPAPKSRMGATERAILAAAAADRFDSVRVEGARATAAARNLAGRGYATLRGWDFARVPKTGGGYLKNSGSWSVIVEITEAGRAALVRA